MEFALGLKLLTQVHIKRVIDVVFLSVLLHVLCARLCCSFVYTGHSAFGCFVAIAVPLNIPHRNAFVSYNFATTYGLPNNIKSVIPGNKGTFGAIEETNENSSRAKLQLGEIKQSNATDNFSGKRIKHESSIKRLITKRAVYQMLKDKLKMFGFEPKFCLLKLVCEVNASFLGKNNGVLGSILHVLLTPSASTFENLPRSVYKAEEDGLNGECHKYEVKCPNKILDIFSVPIENLMININHVAF